MFSIITPTFNRAHTIKRVFDSLKKQSSKDFEWIIIDDASTDNTKELITSWKTENLSFNIHYHLLPENKGKPNAVNEGLKLCQRPYTIIADSDDSFIPSTIEELKQLWLSVELTEKSEEIAGIWTLVHDEKGKLVGDPFPVNFWQVNIEDRVLKRKKQVKGEKWHSWRTSILKKYQFFHSDHSFISEGITWNRINREYDFLCVNIFHRIYYASPDGLILKKKTRLELEKIKFYNAYYQLYQTPITKILRYGYYRHYAFNYVVSQFTYKDKSLQLDILKYVVSIIISIGYIPKRFFYFLTYKSRNNV
ncbi:glycosyltransferase family 2 protein [Maribacter thermophilus]|uniref:glycosyltransferase family 2 protein n=1 Tax=Maribacter thermophilus TaxID=1197874 RepID=UPI00069CAE63|nr:glycosyltransferase family 2 protein [Maribacter thermophilus]